MYTTSDHWFKSGDVEFFDDKNQLHVIGRKGHILLVADKQGETVDIGYFFFAK